MRKRMKWMMVFLLSLSLIACSSSKIETAEQAAESILKSIKSGDLKTLGRYVDTKEIFKVETPTMEGPELDTSQFSAIFEKLEYKILSSTEDGTFTRVNVEISTIDMAATFQQFLTEMFKFAFEQAFEVETMSEPEVEAKIAALFKTTLDDHQDKRVTNTVDMKLSQEGQQWKLKIENDFLNAILGNLIEANWQERGN